MDLQEFLKDEANKEQFIQVVKELGYESPEEVKGLRDKRDELLGKVSKYKSTISEYEKKLEEKEKMLDKFNGLDYTEIDGKSKGSDELSVLKRKVAKYEEDFSLTKKERDALEAELNNTLIKNTLLSTLDELKIDKKHKNLIISAHMPRAKVEKGDNGREVVIESGDGLGLPVKDYFKKFIESDGSIYLEQPVNAGSGASKYSGSGSGKTVSDQEFKNMSPRERSEFMKSGGQIT